MVFLHDFAVLGFHFLLDIKSLSQPGGVQDWFNPAIEEVLIYRTKGANIMIL